METREELEDYLALQQDNLLSIEQAIREEQEELDSFTIDLDNVDVELGILYDQEADIMDVCCDDRTEEQEDELSSIRYDIECVENTVSSLEEQIKEKRTNISYYEEQRSKTLQLIADLTKLIESLPIGIAPNVVCDNTKYMFGDDDDK